MGRTLPPPIEVPEARIRPAIQLAAGATWLTAGYDLQLDVEAITLRWFRPGSDLAPPADLPADRAWERLCHTYRARLHGAYVRGERTIWIRATLSLRATVLVVAHELRHVWQERHQAFSDFALSLRALECDAKDYAAHYLVRYPRVLTLSQKEPSP